MSKKPKSIESLEEKEITRGLRGSSLLVAGRCLSLGINFCVQVAAIRYFSKEDYGVFAVALSIVAVASVAAAFGMDKTALRVLPGYESRQQRSKFAAAILVMMTTVTFCSLVIIGGIYASLQADLWSLEGKGSATVLLILAWLIPCNVLDCLITSLLSVFCQPRAIFVRQHVVGPLFKLLAVLAVIAAGGGIVTFAIGQLIASVIGLLIYAALIQKALRDTSGLAAFRWTEVTSTLSEIFGFSIALIFGDLAFLMRSAVVVLIVSYFHNPSQAASFQAVFPAARLIDLVIATFTMLFMPAAARIFAVGDMPALDRLYRRTTIWTVVLSFPLFLICFVLSTDVCLHLFGSAYAESGSILAVLSLGFFINSSLGMNLRLVRVLGRLRVLVLVDAISMAFAIALNFLLIPQWGAMGGAVAVCVGFLLQGICCQFAVGWAIGINPLPWRLVKVYLCSGALACGAWQVQNAFHPPIHVMLPLLCVASASLLVANRRELDIARVFPEVAHAPIIGRLFNV